MINISVIVPIYNSEKYLKRCLHTLVNQTLRDIEIICVNDGSTDKSAEILNEYVQADKRIIVINNENLGISASRNAGLKVAQGEYIGFVDSDDWIDMDFFEQLYKAAKQYDADAVCSSIKRCYESGKCIDKFKIQQEAVLTATADKYKFLEIPKKCYLWNKIYKTSELNRQKLTFKENIDMCEDVFFSIRFFYASKKLVAVPNVNYYYWVNNTSISRTANDKNQLDKLAARADFIKFSRERHIICDEQFYVKRKIFYKLFGIPLLKIYEWETIKKYYLFGLIPFFEKRISL
ncbi:MAG: glycosyltransferase family 2 protein [Alphaproteobacteria bacterium]|nr:glycosyltransferase family 2 protein [Alphaproteobacteria bacterium]